MGNEPLQDLVARLEQERMAADRGYNDALTAVDRALHEPPVLPSAPAAFDESRLPDINGHCHVLPDGAPVIDRSIKGRLRGFVWRIVGRPLEEQQQFNAALVDHLNRNATRERQLSQVVEAVRDAMSREVQLRTRFESLLVQYFQSITGYIDTKDRSLAGPELRQRQALTEQRLLGLKREVERLGTVSARATGEATAPPSGAFSGQLDSPTYVGFEDVFRGSRSDIAARVQDYLPLLESVSDVLDIGCGRGELLEALRDRGVTVRGVDTNPAMVEVCGSRGLDVVRADALAYLERQDDASVGALVAIQVVEHFEPAYLMRFLETAHHKMRPGAPLVLETINPACWLAFFEAYLRDITHVRALHPETLTYLVHASGFSHADVHYRRPVPECDRLETVAVPDGPGTPLDIIALAKAVNAHAQKLNGRLFSSTDYVLVARR